MFNVGDRVRISNGCMGTILNRSMQHGVLYTNPNNRSTNYWTVQRDDGIGGGDDNRNWIALECDLTLVSSSLTNITNFFD
jgi:hypothetical protein